MERKSQLSEPEIKSFLPENERQWEATQHGKSIKQCCDPMKPKIPHGIQVAKINLR